MAATPESSTTLLVIWHALVTSREGAGAELGILVCWEYTGAVSVLLSRINLMQFLKLVPVLGIYIILVQKVFWTVMKVRTISVFIVEICHYTRKYMHAATPRLC
jgi:hypothetical protein